MSFELSTVWNDWNDLSSSKEIDNTGGNTNTNDDAQQSARNASIVTEDAVQLQKILIQEIMLLRTQSQKKDIMLTIGGLIMFAILINNIDRLHSRIHHIELQGRR